jgi:hypothetical protein
MLGKKSSNNFNFKIPKLNITSPKKKGASLFKQKQWASFSSKKRNFLRNILPDTDGDRVPNKFDCSPLNTMRQDFTPFRYNDASKMTAARRFGGQNLKRLKKLGQGRDRTVYALDKDKVLKVAKNPGGLTQNTYEKDLDWNHQIKPVPKRHATAIIDTLDTVTPGSKKFLMNKKIAIQTGETITDDAQFGMGSARAGGYMGFYEDTNGPLKGMIIQANTKTIGLKNRQNLKGDLLTFHHEIAHAKREEAMRKKGLIPFDRSKPAWKTEPIEYKEINEKGNEVTVLTDKVTPVADYEIEAEKYKSRINKKINASNINLDSVYDRHYKGASEEKQQEWKEMSSEERAIERDTLPDGDGDRVPDKYDCNKDNIMEQGFVKRTENEALNFPNQFKSFDNVKVKKMSPYDYLNKVKFQEAWENLQDNNIKGFKHYDDMSVEEYSKSEWRHEPKISHLKKSLKRGDSIPGLELHEDREDMVVGHEGRHRAAAAMELGVREVPVSIGRHRRRDAWDNWDMSEKATREDTIPGEFEGQITENGFDDDREPTEEELERFNEELD